MASRREPVVLQGTLRGQGHERPCRATATKVTMPGELVSEYAHIVIADSDNFPDGDYELTMAGRTFPLTRRDGSYLLRE